VAVHARVLDVDAVEPEAHFRDAARVFERRFESPPVHEHEEARVHDVGRASGRPARGDREAVPEPGRVQEGKLDLADRADVRGVVEDLDLRRAEEALLALVVDGAGADRVDAVRVARRVDVQDEARDDRGRVVRKVRRDVRPVDARDGLPLEEPVDDHVDVVDLAVVHRPAGDRDDSVHHAGVRLREVHVAERRFVLRVVDLDRHRRQEIRAAGHVRDLDVDGVRPVREVRGHEVRLPAGVLSGRARVLRECLEDVRAREVDVRPARRRDPVRVVGAVHEDIDVGHQVAVEGVAHDLNVPGDGRAAGGKVHGAQRLRRAGEGAPDVRVSRGRRRRREQDCSRGGRRKEEGLPNHHEPPCVDKRDPRERSGHQNEKRD
jgi:hypothetical protein